MTVRLTPLARLSRTKLHHAAVVALLALPMMFSPAKAAAQDKAGPDVLTFTNGDKLTGKVLSEAGGNVTFQSDTSGTITVPWKSIKALHSSGKFAVITNDQKLRVGRPAPQVPVGTVDFSSDSVQVAGKTIASKDAAYVVDDAEFENKIHHQPSIFSGWLGSGTLGISLVEATQTSKTFTGALNLTRPIPGVGWLTTRNNTIFNATASYGSINQPAVGTTPASSARTNILHGDIEHDWYLSPRFYALVDASADHNIGSGLQVQQDYGAGFGYAILTQPAQTLNLKTDVHYERQEFYPAGPGLDGIELNLIGMNFGETYMRKFTHGVVLNESALVQPSFNVASAFSAQFAAGLVLPTYKNFGFALGAQDNFINNPPFGFKKNTFQFTAGVNYAFK